MSDSTLLYDLGSQRYKVTNPIPIVLSSYGDEDWADWPEMKMSTHGSSVADAIERLRDQIVERYRQVVQGSGDTSTPQWRILTRCITDLGGP